MTTVSNSQIIKRIILIRGVKVFYFNKLILNDKQMFESPYQLIDGERLLVVVVAVARFLANKRLDLHDTTFSASPSLFKV